MLSNKIKSVYKMFLNESLFINCIKTSLKTSIKISKPVQISNHRISSFSDINQKIQITIFEFNLYLIGIEFKTVACF